MLRESLQVVMCEQKDPAAGCRGAGLVQNAKLLNSVALAPATKLDPRGMAVQWVAGSCGNNAELAQGQRQESITCQSRNACGRWSNSTAPTMSSRYLQTLSVMQRRVAPSFGPLYSGSQTTWFS